MGIVRPLRCSPVSVINFQSGTMWFRIYGLRCRLYGVMLCQGRWYFRTYREDPMDLKLAVSGDSYG